MVDNYGIISVIIPTYNRGFTISEAIDSVFEQSYPYLEVIVVDDCSTDDTADIVQSRYGERVKYVRLAQNGGGAKARNAGIRASSGAWVAFLDSDDVWSPNKISEQLGALRGGGRAISYTNIEFVGKTRGKMLWNSRAMSQNESVSDYILMSGNAIQTSTLLMARSLATEVMFDERLRRHQDWDFIMRAEKQGVEFVYVDKPLVKYRVTEQSISRSPDVAPTMAWLTIASEYLPKAAADVVLIDEVLSRSIGQRPLWCAQELFKVCARGKVPPGRLARSAARLVAKKMLAI